MSYRLIDSNAIADKYPEVNDMPCVFADLPNGLDGSFIDVQPVRLGKWIDVMTEDWCTFDECKCSVCGAVECFNKGWKKFSYCPNCGAKMEV